MQAVQVRTAKDETRERTVRQLSGGERRRVGLALALGFSELIAARSRLRTNLIVLDEVSQHNILPDETAHAPSVALISTVVDPCHSHHVSYPFEAASCGLQAHSFASEQGEQN